MIVAEAAGAIRLMPVVYAVAGRRVEAVEAAAERADPEVAVVARPGRHDNVVAEAMGGSGVVGVVTEGFGGRVEAVEAAERREPDRACPVFIDIPGQAA